jgi:hypothetical protein
MYIYIYMGGREGGREGGMEGGREVGREGRRENRNIKIQKKNRRLLSVRTICVCVCVTGFGWNCEREVYYKSDE